MSAITDRADRLVGKVFKKPPVVLPPEQKKTISDIRQRLEAARTKVKRGAI